MHPECNCKGTTLGNRFYDFPRSLTDIDVLPCSYLLCDAGKPCDGCSDALHELF